MRSNLRLWNQKRTDTGSFLFGRMAVSYEGLLCGIIGGCLSE
jgi:hypothetical protein